MNATTDGTLVGSSAIEPADRTSGQVKTLSKGLAVLEMIIANETVRTTDVAEQLGIDKGSASRILHTLVDSGFVTRGTGRLYQVGPKLTQRAGRRRSQLELRMTARPLLEKLVQLTGESAHLSILADNQVLYLDRADSTAPLRVDRPVGTLAPLHCTALGKVFMAFDEVPVPADMPGFTVRTITDSELMRAHLRQVRSQGYALDDEEFDMGIRCVSAPLYNSEGNVVAALGLSGPTARVNLARAKELGELVRQTADEFALQ